MDQEIEIRQETEAKPFDISVYTSKYVTPVLERKWIAIFFIVLGILAAIVVNSLVKSEFTSQGVLVVEEPMYEISKVREDAAARRTAALSYIEAEVEKLKSGSFASEVLKLLPDNAKEDLLTQLDIGPQITDGIEGFFSGRIGEDIVKKTGKLLGREPDSTADDLKTAGLIGAILERVDIRANPRTGLVWITARTLDRDVAPLLVKNYIDIWMAENLEENKRGITSETKFTEGQRNRVYREFTEAEQALIDFKRRYGIPGELEVARDVELDIELKRLEGNLKMARERYLLMDRVYLETQTKEAGIVGNIKVIDFPIVPSEAERGRVLRLIYMLIGGGFALGIGIPLLLDFIKGPVRHEIDITSSVNIPLLGYIPKI